MTTTNTDYSKKCHVLADFWSKHKDNPALGDLLNYNNVGFPLAYMQEHNLCVATDNGINYINETFDNLVDIVEESKPSIMTIPKRDSPYRWIPNNFYCISIQC